MTKIGITGGIASGKSILENFFREKGAKVLDTDKVVHELLETDNKIQLKIEENLGNFKINGKIDRKLLGEVVFSDENKLRILESILHPEVIKITQVFLNENQQEKVVVVSAPLLYEAKMERLFDYIILVYADEIVRIKRLIETRSMSFDTALKRIKSMPEMFAKKDLANFIIENNATLEDFLISAENLYKKIQL